MRAAALRVVLLLPPVLVALAAPCPAADDFNAEEAAVRQLRKATTFSRNGLHHALLLALRDLRDPAMKPLFQSLVQGEHWSIQLDAILGLAEIDASGKVDPWLLGRLRSEQDRADAIGVALELERLGKPEIEALLARDDVPSIARVVLFAELLRLGGTPDPAPLQRLASNADPAIAGLAALILAELGDAAPAATFAETLAGLSASERDGVTVELANAARRYKLKSAIDLLAPRVTGADETPGPQEAVVSMALSLDPARGLPLWRKALGTAPSTSTRVRHGLVLLPHAAQVPPESFDALTAGLGKAPATDQALIKAMAGAGRALAGKGERAAALTKLYDLGQRRCCRYVIGATDALAPEEAAAVLGAVVDRMDDPALRSPDAFNDAIDSAAKLALRAPDALRQRLATAEDDGPLQEAILLGLANARAPAASELAASVRRIGAGRADSVALVVLARDPSRLTPDDLVQLGRIAGGGGRVDETLQAQAAWLWLERSGRLEAALSQLMAPASSAGDAPAERR